MKISGQKKAFPEPRKGEKLNVLPMYEIDLSSYIFFRGITLKGLL